MLLFDCTRRGNLYVRNANDEWVPVPNGPSPTAIPSTNNSEPLVVEIGDDEIELTVHDGRTTGWLNLPVESDRALYIVDPIIAAICPHRHDFVIVGSYELDLDELRAQLNSDGPHERRRRIATLSLPHAPAEPDAPVAIV